MDLLKINLQLFAEGGEGATASSGDGADTGVQADPAANQGVEANPEAKEDRQQAYAKFKNDFKDEYKSDVESMMKDRLKNIHSEKDELSKRITTLNPLVEMLSTKYGVEPTDIEGLVKAFEADDSNYEEAAYARDMSVEQFRAVDKIERENRSYREQEEQRKRQEQIARWNQEADELKKIYPNFDPETELKNEQFKKLLGSGVDMRTCYEVAHKDDIMRGAMQFTAEKAAEKVANSVMANASRPSENGLSSQAAAVSRLDINNLSREQMADLKRRAANGESINLRDKI